MNYTICRTYRGPDSPINKNETSKSSNGVMREHEGAQFIKCHFQHKGYQASINRAVLYV